MDTSSEFETAEVPALEIVLDPLNARIDIPEGASQEEIRTLLLNSEDIGPLAKRLVRMGGEMPGERIIVVREGERYVVLEGNRRTCAVQCLLNPDAVPERHRGKFPLLPETVRTRLSKLRADVAPSRKAAQPTISRRHTDPGVKQWSPRAKQRRILILLRDGYSIDDICDEFDMTKGKVVRLLRDHGLLSRVKQLKCWSPAEQERLNDPKLKVNAFTRFFTLKHSKEPLKLTFDELGSVSSTLDDETFDRAMERLARALLLPANSEQKEDTRTKPEELYPKLFGGDELRTLLTGVPGMEIPAEQPPMAAPQNPPKRRSPQPPGPRFFETFVCPPDIADDQIRASVREISIIDHVKLPMCAAFLLRSLIERTMNWCIKEKGLRGDLMNEYSASLSTKKGGVPDPNLDFVIRFAIRRHDDIFNENVKRLLEQWLNVKEYANLVVHGKLVLATANSVENMAAMSRELLSRILARTILLP